MSAPVIPETSKSSNSSITDLLTWKDPIKTGKVVGSIVLGLIVFKGINLLNIFFHLSYIALLCTYFFELFLALLTSSLCCC